MTEIAVQTTASEGRNQRRFRLGRSLRWAALALTVLFAAIWLVFLRPTFLGGPATYVIVSGRSMEPALHAGDLVVARKHESYSLRKTIVYDVPRGEPGAGTRVIHRIVGGSEQAGFIVKGDNREGQDPWRPKGEDVVGEMWFHVPRAGIALLYLQTPLGAALVAGLTTLLFMLLGGGGASPTSPRRPGPRARRARSSPAD